MSPPSPDFRVSPKTKVTCSLTPSGYYDCLLTANALPVMIPPLILSFTHISFLTEVLTVINLAAIFHNTVHLFELSTEPNVNTITA